MPNERSCESINNSRVMRLGADGEAEYLAYRLSVMPTYFWRMLFKEDAVMSLLDALMQTGQLNKAKITRDGLIC